MGLKTGVLLIGFLLPAAVWVFNYKRPEGKKLNIHLITLATGSAVFFYFISGRNYHPIGNSGFDLSHLDLMTYCLVGQHAQLTRDMLMWQENAFHYLSCYLVFVIMVFGHYIFQNKKAATT